MNKIKDNKTERNQMQEYENVCIQSKTKKFVLMFGT